MKAYAHLKRLFFAIAAHPAVTRARAVRKSHDFKSASDEESRRALFLSNYPPAA